MSSGSPPRTALAHEDHCLLGAEDSGTYRGGDLADRMAGTGSDLREAGSGVREDRKEGDEARSHDEGLGDRGIADGLGVGGGAMGDEVDTAHRGEPVEAFAHSLELKPWGEETGGLGALARSDDNKHGSTFPVHGAAGRTAPANVRMRFL